MSEEKIIILNRIREALRNNPAPRPHVGEGGAGSEGASLTPHNHIQRDWLPKVGATREEQITLFTKQSEGLKTEIHRCSNIAAAREILMRLAAEGGWKKIASHSLPETDALLEGCSLPLVRTEKGYAVEELESCDAGITGCECLVAQTGSIMVSVASAGGRALSVLPPHHLVIARSSQMVPDLTAAFDSVKQRYGNSFPSFLSFITGPSRTGDIERILVLGAHGPKRLSILLLEE